MGCSQRAGAARAGVALRIAASVALVGLSLAGCGGNSTASPGPTSVSSSPGSNGAASFIGRASNAVVFIQWTRAGSTLSGSLQQTVLKQPSGSGTNSQSTSFTGTIAGDGLTLQLGQAIGSATSLSGQFSGSGFTLTYPGASSSSLITISFTPSQLADYNQAVSTLDSSPYSSPCTLYLDGQNAQARFSGANAPTDCEAFVQGQSAQSNTWTTGPQGSGSSLTQVCDLSSGSDEAVVSDSGGQAYGQEACKTLSSNGWSPSSGASAGTDANGNSLLVLGCQVSHGSVTNTCYYTAGPLTGSAPKPTVGSYFGQHDCTWEDNGRSVTGALELFKCL